MRLPFRYNNRVRSRNKHYVIIAKMITLLAVFMECLNSLTTARSYIMQYHDTNCSDRKGGTPIVEREIEQLTATRLARILPLT